MKRIYIILAAAALMSAASSCACSGSSDQDAEEPAAITEYYESESGLSPCDSTSFDCNEME